MRLTTNPGSEGPMRAALALCRRHVVAAFGFSALVNLAVVTNVIPYIVSLSAVVVMMKTAGVAENVYRRNCIILVIALAYSVFAIYASGKDAVLGGTLVLGVTYVIWGFIAPRFTTPAKVAADRVVKSA